MGTRQHLSWLAECALTHPIYMLTSDVSSLQYADNAQQAFSSDNTPTLHLAIPALEALYKAWSSRADADDRPKYLPFTPALRAACAKIDQYYEKTTESPAYIMSMSTYPHAYPEHD
jgi:hypothetical protein